ncbi:transporter substrate-binding domain-containing protein [Actinomadura scrupuli]|uniref:transporter substrate-binding domain-containing protein n=1 Tax=Actinomadura scrupuli TaxID=559629 RepID=UPI003D96A550
MVLTLSARTKWALAAAAAASVVLIVAAVAIALHAEQRRLLVGTITVGIRDPSTDDGAPVKPGIMDRALRDFLVARLGVKLNPKPVFVTAADRESKLVSGAVQLIISTYSITADRERQVAFVGPYMQTRQAIAVPESSRLTTFAQARTQVICTAWGSNTEQKSPSGSPSPVEEREFPACFDRVRRAPKAPGSPVGVFSDRIVLERHLPDDFKLLLADDSQGATSYYGVGMPRGYPEECERVFELVKEWVGGRTWDRTFAQAFPTLDASQYRPDPGYLRIPSSPEDSGYSCRSSRRP